MRALGAAAQAIITAGALSQNVRVSIKDSGGTFRDLTTYPGENLVDKVDWTDSVDSTGATATVNLKREVEKLSLAPLMTASALNRGFNPAASYAALLAVGRMLKIEVSTDPMDKATANWIEVFRGYVDTVDPGGEGEVTLQCRDESALLMDTFIETERAYAMFTYGGTTRGARIWTPNTAYVSGEYIIPTDGRRAVETGTWEVTTGGTSGTHEPLVWTNPGTVAGGANYDGTEVLTYRAALANTGYSVESVMQRILTENGLSVTLYGSSPGWNIRMYSQQREPVYEAIRTLAQQIGWDVRYKWDSGSSSFRLTLFEPDRTKATVDYTFTAADYDNISGLATDISGIRNVVRVVYSDRTATAYPDGTYPRVTVESTDSTSITAYGRRFMEIAEASTSNIDTSTEADKMADGALADLKDPSVEQEITLTFGFPWVELGDRYTFTANNRHYSADQTWSVVSWSHTAADGIIRTTIRTRGQPSLGYTRWLSKDSRPSHGRAPHSLAAAQTAAGTTLTATPVVGGIQLVTTDTPAPTSFPREREFHLSTVSGFTPDSSTLVAVTTGNDAIVTDLIPGTTYYSKTVNRYHNASKVVRTEPSTQATVVAGRAGAGHLEMGVNWGRVPLNGGFETWSDTNELPDHWELESGSWVSNPDFYYGTGAEGRTGVNFLGYTTNASGHIIVTRDFFEVTAGLSYLAEWHAKEDVAGTATVLALGIRWYDSAQATISSEVVVSAASADMTTDVWYRQAAVVIAPATAKFAKLRIYATTAGTSTLFIDSVAVAGVGDDWVNPSLGNSWTNYNSATHTAAAYRKDANGRVHLKGLIKDGTVGDGTPPFTLPAGYRPPVHANFAVIAGGDFGRVEVQSDGDVTVIHVGSGSNGYVSLDGISFDTWE
jgi:hypothetical protein